MLEPGFTQGKGLRILVVREFATGKVTKTFAVLYSGEFKKQGIVVNHCPSCGTHISGHLQKGGEVT